MRSRQTHSDKSIDDILQSIRNVIHNREHKANNAADEELELTEMIEDEQGDALLSQESRAKTESIIEDFIETATTLGHHQVEQVSHQNLQSTPIEDFIKELLRPQIRCWLDDNLPGMVKQVVSEEIKSLVANIQKNKNV
jgi:cell pole-organizing protein PopZ